MKTIFSLLAIMTLVACANPQQKQQQQWYWEKPGATSRDFNMDSGQCRAQAFSGTGGMLSFGTVMIMESCMQGKGWYRVNKN